MCIKGVDHIAIIVSDARRAVDFYCSVLGCSMMAEYYRQERRSWKIDLKVPSSNIELELFTFPDVSDRLSKPEALGARHLAFRVASIEQMHAWCEKCGVECEPIRTDDRLKRQFFFVKDPDGLPIEFVEMK